MMERILKVELKSAGAAFGLFVASIVSAMGIQIGKTEMIACMYVRYPFYI